MFKEVLPDRVTSDRGMLHTLAAEVRACNRTNGWYDKERGFEADIALLHSEISEAFEAYRERGFDSWEKADGKPMGVASELADELVRLLDTADRLKVDLFAEYRRKMDYNWNRGYRHGGKIV